MPIDVTAKKCGKGGCYTEDQTRACAKCKKEIKKGQPRHSFIDFMDPGAGIRNFHCKCIR